MKILSLFLVLLLFTQTVFAAGKLQGADFKTEAELISAGATKAQLLDDSKIYITANGINDKLSTAITNGQLGGGSSAGGINLIFNDSLEFGLTGYTNSGGTFTQQTYTNGKTGDTKYGRFVASGSGQYVETTAYAVPDSLGKGCQFDLDAQVTSGTWTYLSIDGSGNTLASGTVTVPSSSTWQKQQTLSSSCPAAGTTIKLRLLAGGAGTINFDHIYNGGNKNTVNISQARNAGSAVIPANASCLPIRANTAYGDFPTLAACLGPTINFSSIGSWQTTDTDLPQITINNLPPGRYVVMARHAVYNPINVGVSCVRLSDGTTSGEGECISVPTSEITSVTLKYDVSYTTSGNRTFKIQGKAASGSVSILNDTNYGGIKFDVFYYPEDSQTAVTSDQSSWFIDANIGGANPSLGTSSVSSYAEITNASLDMVLNAGSAAAEIPCSSTNASTGLTCSAGNEGIGAVFTPPYSGYFDVCGYFNHYSNQGAGGNTRTSFQFVETNPASQTIIQEGKTRLLSVIETGSSASGYPQSNCGTFYFSSTSEKTIRLMYEQQMSGTVVVNQIFADRGAAYGQADVRITVRPSTMNIARPVLTGDTVLTPGKTGVEIFSASYGGTNASNVCSSGTCFLQPIGDGFSSITFNTTGDYNLNFSKTYSMLNCVANAESSGVTGYIPDRIQCISCNSISNFQTRTDGGATANTFGTIICHGVK